jgi:large subunit ribosomal protein L13Ae
MMIYKAIRGMIPRKTTRGANALKRLKVFDGCPPKYDKVKKKVIPDALRVMKLKAASKYVKLGDLAKEVGWKYGDIIASLEKKRLSKGKSYHLRKEKALAKHQAALKAYRGLGPKLEPKKKKAE